MQEIRFAEKNSGRIVLVTGGVRSGKSLFAEQLAASLANKVLYLATSEIRDQEMAIRVRSHQNRRPSNWSTIEEPIKIKEVIAAIGQEYQVVLLDCLTLFVANLMAKHGLMHETEDNSLSVIPEQENLIYQEIEQICRLLKTTSATTIIVTNEVGWGIVPAYPVGRLFRDLVGKCNQIAASYSDEVYLLVAGLPVRIK